MATQFEFHPLRQIIAVTPQGVRLTLAVRNLADRAMPVGLGFHPYFPRTGRTILHARHRGECRNDGDCLPLDVTMQDQPTDWWHGQPVARRKVDTVYVGREGPLAITWPERGLQVVVECDPVLAHTAVLVPAGADRFCAEPVSHVTNAVNRPLGDWAMPALAPDAEVAASIRLVASVCHSGAQTD